MKNNLYWLILVFCFTAKSHGQIITRDSIFDFNWKFYKGNIEDAEKPEFNDRNWRILDIPHDWSIEDLPVLRNNDSLSKAHIVSGPFDSEAIGGTNTGFTFGGTGWYRKHFKAIETWQNKTVIILFDGVYMNADVWINGHHLGNHPYGYTAFWYDISKYLNYGDKENILAVQVKNEGINSRWYSGSGIYRHVTLNIVDKIHIAPWGIYIKTVDVDSLKATINIEATIENQSYEKKDIEFLVNILDPNLKVVASSQLNTRISNSVPSKVKLNLSIPDPALWSTNFPNLYRAVCTIRQNGNFLDKTETAFGIRTLKFDSENGFFLNGENIKLKGGSMHANNGPLGAVAYDRAEERRVELMKEVGFNSIRCGHNPPSSVFLDACDRLGMLVIDEAFDVWTVGWRPDDYHVYFKDWWQHDIASMLLRDRNHPSIITWSICNQVREARDSAGIALAYQIADVVRSIDPSRPVSANVAMFISGNWHDGLSELWHDYDPVFSALDICGYSYQSSQYETDHERLPDRIMFSSEIDPRNSFTNWMRATDNKYVLGNFEWTAMDFMGEVSLGWYDFTDKPKSLFSWNSSYSGDIDLCGFRRPRSFYRDILFNNENKLSVFVYTPVPSFEGDGNSLWGWDDVKASWTWPGYENKVLPVEVYSACDSVELILNGKSIGIKSTSRATEFKAKWQVPYQQGTLIALGFKNNRTIAKSELITADKPYKIKLKADRDTIKADNQDLSFITIEILDKNDIIVPYANNLVHFEVKGEGNIAAVGNSNPISIESYQQPYRKAYEGRCLLIVKSNNKEGQIIVNAISKGIESDKILIKTIKELKNE
jgi:beta-galactosidase